MMTAFTAEQVATIRAIVRDEITTYRRINDECYVVWRETGSADAYQPLLAWLDGLSDRFNGLPQALDVGVQTSDTAVDSVDAAHFGSLDVELDSLEVVAEGNGSPSIGASGPESRDAFEPIVGAVPGVEPSATPGTTQGSAA